MYFAWRVALASSLLLHLLPLTVSAQTLGSVSPDAAFSISVQPQYPAPNGSATLSLLSSSLDLTNATMAVTVAGKKIYTGPVRPFAVPLGKAGGVTNATVTVSSGGADYTQTIA